MQELVFRTVTPTAFLWGPVRSPWGLNCAGPGARGFGEGERARDQTGPIRALEQISLQPDVQRHNPSREAPTACGSDLRLWGESLEQ